MCLHLCSYFIDECLILDKRAQFSSFMPLFLDFASYIGLFLIEQPSFKVGIHLVLHC